MRLLLAVDDSPASLLARSVLVVRNAGASTLQGGSE